MTSRQRARWVTWTLVAGVAAASLVACSDGGSADVATLPAVSTTAAAPGSSEAPTEPTDGEVVTTVAVTDAAASTEPPDSTVATTSEPAAPTTVLPEGAVGLSADGPWRLVDSAPGVESPGLVYELMPKLWAFIPTEPSPDDGNLFVPQPQDIPIIEAYLQAMIVYFRAATQNPIDLEDPGWAEYFGDGGAGYRDVLEPKQAQGQYVDLDLGVVLRPHVIGEQRTDSHAIVFDCVLDGAVFRLVDGSLADGSVLGVVHQGLGAPIRFLTDGWQAEHVGVQAEACS